MKAHANTRQVAASALCSQQHVVAMLLQADIGIIVGENKLLKRVCSEFNIQRRPLVAAPAEPPASAPNPPVLYEADSWYDIEAFLFGPATQDALASSGSVAAAAAAATAGAGMPTRTATIATAGSLVSSGMLAAAVAAAEAAVERRTKTRSSSSGGARVEPAAQMPRVLSIAGSDSGGGAGIQADLKVCCMTFEHAVRLVDAVVCRSVGSHHNGRCLPPGCQALLTLPAACTHTRRRTLTSSAAACRRSWHVAASVPRPSRP